MVNAQEWLNTKYFNKWVKEIKRDWREGDNGYGSELIIKDFPKLEEVDIGGMLLTKLQIIDCPGLIFLNCSVNALAEIIVSNCPKLKEINASSQIMLIADHPRNSQIVENINLSGAPNLERIKFTDKSSCLSGSPLTDPYTYSTNDQNVNSFVLNFQGAKITEISLHPSYKLPKTLDPFQLIRLQVLNVRDNSLISLDLTHSHQIKRIDCCGNKLEELKFGKSDNLTYLNCAGNQLKELDLTKCPNLKMLLCGNNFLTNLDLSHNLNLEFLSVGKNNFSELNLSFLKKLVNLKELDLFHSYFLGDLMSLNDLNKLTILEIFDTNINSGLEYLPESLKYFSCNGQLAEKLKGYGIDNKSDVHNYQNWKEDHYDLVQRAQKIIELEKSLNNLYLALSNCILTETVDKALQIFVYQTQEKIKELKKQNEEYYENKIEIPPK